MIRSIHYEFEIEYNKPIELVWKRISDTNRLHETSDVEAYIAEEVIQSDKSIIRYCKRFEKRKVKLSWNERFGEWKSPYYLRQQRNYTFPFKGSLLFEFWLTPTEKGCKQIVKGIYTYTLFMGFLFEFLGLFRRMTNKRMNVLKQFVLAKDSANPGSKVPWKKPVYTQKQCTQVKRLIKKLNIHYEGSNLGQKLADYIMYSLAIDVTHIRPLELARKWNLSNEKVITLFIQAMILGLVDMRWDIICPFCRAPKVDSSELQDIPNDVHCSSCNIDYKLNFNENIEMIFLPAKWLRPIEETTFCMLSAQLTPHIILQLRINSGKQDTYDFALKPGIYRCRILEDQLMVEFSIESGDITFPTIVLERDELKLLPEKNKNLILINNSKNPRYFIIENTSYKENALTGEKANEFLSKDFWNPIQQSLLS